MSARNRKTAPSVSRSGHSGSELTRPGSARVIPPSRSEFGWEGIVHGAKANVGRGPGFSAWGGGLTSAGPDTLQGGFERNLGPAGPGYGADPDEAPLTGAFFGEGGTGEGVRLGARLSKDGAVVPKMTSPAGKPSSGGLLGSWGW